MSRIREILEKKELPKGWKFLEFNLLEGATFEREDGATLTVDCNQDDINDRLEDFDKRRECEVTNIKICKLPYQEHPFVHGIRNGKDVWLMTNGQWTEIDGHEDSSIPFKEN